MYDILFKDVSKLLRLKEAASKALLRLGIITLRDMLFYKPISYKILSVNPDLSKLKPGDVIHSTVKVDDIEFSKKRGSPTKIYVSNDTGSITLVFFNKIPKFIYSKLKNGNKITISGKVQFFDYYFQIHHPDFIFNSNIKNSIQPIYPLTYGILNKQLYSYIIDAISLFETCIDTNIVAGQEGALNNYREIINNQALYINHLVRDIKNLHFIDIQNNLPNIDHFIEETRKSLAHKELFAGQVALINLKCRSKNHKGRVFLPDHRMHRQILTKLGFTLTDSQRAVIDEIEMDQKSESQMMRMLQGDVGSGKTLVSLLTIMNVVSSGSQCCMMAPTDLLSTQHYQFYLEALSDYGINIALLTGKTKAKDRRDIIAKLANGDINIIIGTHALFQDNIIFHDLGYVIIDEQHRFGVQQRLDLINKASHPDVLFMTATPIPRSLALTIYGDMSISQITQKPSNRLPIITTVTSINKKQDIINALSAKIAVNEKIYWVCPLIDQNDDSLNEQDLNTENETSEQIKKIYADVSTRYREISQKYPDIVGVVHGKMKANEKDDIMQKFASGALSILVATTVIEVGINVPDATLIIIENAEKFGLAALHQLRGRVGRSNLQSYCIMLYNPKYLSNSARQRLNTIKNSNDGFYIAEQDLLMRGGGEILGTKQSGEPEFFFADLSKDTKLLLSANDLAKSALLNDFMLWQSKLFYPNS